MVSRSLPSRQQKPSTTSTRSASCPPEKCRNRDQCSMKAESIQHRMQAMVQVVLSDYEHLVRDHLFGITDHADARMDERDIPLRAVYEVLECYHPIEWVQVPRPKARVDALGKRLFHYDPYRILITGESDLIERPVCVVCGYARPEPGQPWALRVLTVYNPQEYPHQWNADFTKRQCFCEDETHTSRLTGVQARIEQYYQTLGVSDSVVYTTPW